jgi:hypothetical protein
MKDGSARPEHALLVVLLTALGLPTSVLPVAERHADPMQ